MSAEAEAVPVVQDAPAAEEAPMIYYKFISSDGVEFRVSKKAVGQSETLNSLVSTLDYTLENFETKNPLPIENIKGDALDLVFRWCEQHKDEPIPVDDDSVPKNVEIPVFDKNLMEIDNNLLFDLIVAANYLNIKGLMNVSCKKVADMAKGKTPEEMRIIYGIPTDEEDEAAEKAAADAEAARRAKAAKEAAAKEDADAGGDAAGEGAAAAE